MTDVVAEVISTIALDQDDRRRLVALHPVLSPHFAGIADEFYASMLATPATAAIFGPDQVERLHRSLVDWISSGLLGPYDDAFFVKCSSIGHRHIQTGLAQHSMIAAMSVMRRSYKRRIASAYPAHASQAIGDAVDKLLDLELAVMLQHYQHDSEARVRHAEQQRRREQIEAMRTLCTGLAHEVRNPVNSAKLQLALASRRLRKGVDELHLAGPLERVGQEIDRLTVLLDEFLAFARPPALDARPADVAAVVRDVVADHQVLATRSGVALTLETTTSPIVAEVDATKIRQIVASLVCNAIDAASRGGTGTVAVHHGEGRVHIHVTDDGPGIPTEVLPRIYEPFFSTKDGGTGMGMSIAHSLVALHDGTIEVSSSSQGTVVEVTIPRRRPGA